MNSYVKQEHKQIRTLIQCQLKCIETETRFTKTEMNTVNVIKTSSNEEFLTVSFAGGGVPFTKKSVICICL